MTYDLIAMLFGNLAFTLNATAFWMRDVRRLRWVAIASSLCFITYSATATERPLWLMIGWSFVFITINTYRLIAEPRSRRAPRTPAIG